MVFHLEHNHWHLEAASRYTLFRPGHESYSVVHARKTSFCMRDSERVPAGLETTHRPLFYRACGA